MIVMTQLQCYKLQEASIKTASMPNINHCK